VNFAISRVEIVDESVPNAGITELISQQEINWTTLNTQKQYKCVNYDKYLIDAKLP
jgi:hypothetical protein